MRQLADEYHTLRDRYGIGIEYTGSRQDVIDGGFYLSRGIADDIHAESPLRHATRGAFTPTFERPSVFSSQARGVADGYEYASFDKAMTAYAKNVGYKVRDIHTARYMKTLRDETGVLVGGTPKTLAMKMDPQLVTRMDRLRKQIVALRSTKLRLGERMYKNFEDFLDDPEFDDVDSLFSSLRSIEATVKRGRLKGADMDHVSGVLQRLGRELDELRPEYKNLLARAKSTRGRGPISLSQLSNWSFPDEIALAANEVLEAQRGALVAGMPGVKGALNAANGVNRLYRGIGATMDLSYAGIQGLLGFYSNPRLGALTLETSIKAFGGRRGDQILASFFNDFDGMVVPRGRLDVSGWASQGLHIGGEVSEFQLRGRLQKIPLVRRSNRAFGVAGDSMRLRWADDELVKEMAKGRSLQEIRRSGDLERIANSINGMTGWSPNRAFDDIGDLLLFAPRFLQSRLDTIARAARSVRPGATLDELMARRALLRMMSYGVMLTVGLNMIFAEEKVRKGEPSWLGWTGTDFRPFVDGRKNSNFLRVFSPVGDISLFGTWDSLLGATLAIMTGHPERALRGLGGGTVSIGWDIIGGEDFLRRPTRDTPEHVMHWILRTFTPFAAEEALPAVADIAKGVYKAQPSQIAKGIATAGLEITGVKRTPPSIGEQKQRLGEETARKRGVEGTFGEMANRLGYTFENVFSQEELNQSPDEYWQYDRATRKELKADPEFVALTEEAQRYNPERAEYTKKKDERWEKMFGKGGTLANLAVHSAALDHRHPMAEFRMKMKEHLSEFYAIEEHEQAEAKEKEIFGEDREPDGPFRQAEDIYNRLLWAEDRALVEKLFPDRPYTPIEDELTKDINWDERNRREKYLEDTYGEKFISDMKNISRADLPQEVQDYRIAVEYIGSTGYWHVDKFLAYQNGVSADLEEYRRLKRTDKPEAKAFLDAHEVLRKRVINKVSDFRKMIRSKAEGLDTILVRYGYVSRPIAETLGLWDLYSRGG